MYLFENIEIRKFRKNSTEILNFSSPPPLPPNHHDIYIHDILYLTLMSTFFTGQSSGEQLNLPHRVRKKWKFLIDESLGNSSKLADKTEIYFSLNKSSCRWNLSHLSGNWLT